MLVVVAKGVPPLPFCAIAQTADAVALLVHLADTNAWAVDVEQFKLRHKNRDKNITITIFC